MKEKLCYLINMFLKNIDDKYITKVTEIPNNIKNNITYITNIITNEDFILKRIHRTYEFLKEICLVTSINHPNIVKITDWSFDETYYYIIIEKGEMLSNIDINLTKFIKDIFNAVMFLHGNNIFHGDIKESNIIYYPKTDCYTLIDFGLSSYVISSRSSDRKKKKYVYGVCGTNRYRDPSYYYYDKNDILTELYSIGKTMESIISKYKIDKTDIVNKIINELTTPIDIRKDLMTIGSKYGIEYKRLGYIKMYKRTNIDLNILKQLRDLDIPVEIIIKSLSLAYNINGWNDDIKTIHILIFIFCNLYNYPTSVLKYLPSKVEIFEILIKLNCIITTDNIFDSYDDLRYLGYYGDKNIIFSSLYNGDIKPSIISVDINEAWNKLKENKQKNDLIVPFYNHYFNSLNLLPYDEYMNIFNMIK